MRVTREAIRAEARQLGDLIDAAAERAAPDDLPVLLIALRQARAALEAAWAPDERGAVELPLTPERAARYFPAGRTLRRPVAEADVEAADAAWQAAMARGHRHREQALAGLGPVLTPREAAARLGVSTMTVNNWRRHGRLLAVRLDHHQYLYPAFQFAETPVEGERGVVRHLDRALAALGDRPEWERARFFATPAPALGGQRPIDALRAGDPAAAARVIDLARHGGEMGG